MLNNEQIKNGLKYSIAEGSFANIYANLTGGLFLPAFALLLMASDFTIGLLASIPFFSTIAQIFGSLLVERFRQRKKITIIFAFISRILWVPIVLLIVIFFDVNRDLLLSLIIIIIIVHHIFGSICGVAWLSWMSNLVPSIIRGRFFGLRNSFMGIITITVTLVGGLFLDWYKGSFTDYSPSNSFLILFSLAVVAGLISLFLLSKQPDVEEPIQKPFTIKSIFSEPFKNIQFKKLLRFTMLWSFAVNIASPFYIIYMLKDLHLSYTLISSVTIFAAMANLFGMGFWGHFSDKNGNRPVVIISVLAASLLPFIWLFTGSSAWSVYILIPLLHLAGGFFFAGYNLCSVNLLFGIAPRQNNSMFIALWSMINGLAAGIGAICGGFMANRISIHITELPFEWESIFKIIFLFSFLMRFSSVFMLRSVQDSRGVSLSQAVRILRSVRTWATTMGYHPLLQFFLPGRYEHDDLTDDREIWPFWDTRASYLPIWLRRDGKT